MTSPTSYAKNNADAFLQQLKDLLHIPSVSTLPEQAGAVREAAEWLADNLRRAGLENVKVYPTEGHPVVYGDWLHAGETAPTILIYGHYDVQPAEKSDGWATDPFDPIVRDGQIYARGSSDDKGQMFIHVKAVESIMSTQDALPVNVKFMIEGEEEIGSPNLPAFLSKHRELLAADVCIISDTSVLSEDQPSIIYALRGLVGLEVEVQGPARDLHSGVFGGVVHNPIQALSEILAGLHDANGTITVPGFYDDVVPLSEQERSELARTNWAPEDLVSMTGVQEAWGEQEFTLRERVGARPTLELNGIVGGFYGNGMKTVLPAKALAKISCRLVANQHPDRIFELIRDHIRKTAPATVSVDVRRIKGSASPALIDISIPAMQAAIRAYEKGWGRAPIFMREGGSLPIVADFQRELGAPVILMGFGLNTDNVHGPNEHFSINSFHKGIETVIHFLNEVAKLS